MIFTGVKSVANHVLLNDALCSVDEWCEKWNMKISFNKTTCWSISNKKVPLPFTCKIKNKEVK